MEKHREISNLKPKFKLGLGKKTLISPFFDENDLNDSVKSEFQSIAKLNDHISELIQNNVFFLFIELLKKISTDYKDKGISFNELKNKYLCYFQKELTHSNLFCELLSANLETMDIDQLKEEINGGKIIVDKHFKTYEKMPLQSKKTSYNVENHSQSSSPNDSTECAEENEDFATDNTKCYARTAGKKQCSRKKQKGQNFCGSHLHNQPHGRIDQALDPNLNKPKKRGRPPKNIQKTSIDDNSQIEIVQMDASIENINGIDYIVDNNNGNIYTIPEGFDSEEGTINSDQLVLVGKKLQNDQITWYSDDDLKFIDKSV